MTTQPEPELRPRAERCPNCRGVGECWRCDAEVSQQPGRICGCGHGRAYHDPTCRLCAAAGEQAQQPEPEERQELLKVIADLAVDIGHARQELSRAVLGQAQASTDMSLEQIVAAAVAEYRLMVAAVTRQRDTAEEELARLRAELEQARGTTGQDTTPADEQEEQAVGEQETRQQIRIACAIAERVPVTALEPHDYQEHADAVLPVVQAAVAAGVRRALEDAADAVPGPDMYFVADMLRARATATEESTR